MDFDIDIHAEIYNQSDNIIDVVKKKGDKVVIDVVEDMTVDVRTNDRIHNGVIIVTNVTFDVDIVVQVTCTFILAFLGLGSKQGQGTRCQTAYAAEREFCCTNKLKQRLEGVQCNRTTTVN